MEWGEFVMDLLIPHQDLRVGLSAPPHLLSLRADYVCTPRLARRGLIQTPRSEAHHPWLTLNPSNRNDLGKDS